MLGIRGLVSYARYGECVGMVLAMAIIMYAVAVRRRKQRVTMASAAQVLV